MAVFFRKERKELFDQRFCKDEQLNAWCVGKSGVIFTARVTKKSFSVKVDNVNVRVDCETNLNKASIEFKWLEGGTPKKATLDEAAMVQILKNKPPTVLYKAAAFLCQKHATSSASSPLISGCAVNNFANSSAYPGYKLKLDLSQRRVPFENPFVSGLEKECFLIGQVLASDCTLITYFGETKEQLNELVNFPASRIARPR